VGGAMRVGGAFVLNKLLLYLIEKYSILNLKPNRQNWVRQLRSIKRVLLIFEKQNKNKTVTNIHNVFFFVFRVT